MCIYACIHNIIGIFALDNLMSDRYETDTYVLFIAQQVKLLGCVGNLFEVVEELKGCPVKLSRRHSPFEMWWNWCWYVTCLELVSVLNVLGWLWKVICVCCTCYCACDNIPINATALYICPPFETTGCYYCTVMKAHTAVVSCQH